jgi:uncharacterized protein YbjT (DUF2867 family)
MAPFLPVVGDLLDFGQVRAALDGVRRACFVYPLRPGILEATTCCAQAAREAGVEGLVHRSQQPARADARSRAATDPWLSERVFDGSGVPTVYLRPTSFAQWLLSLAPKIRAGRLHVPFGTGKHAPSAAEDQGRVSAGLLEEPAAPAGKMDPLFGPVETTDAKTARLLRRVLGKDVPYRQIDFEEFRRWQQAGGKNAGGDNSFLFQHRTSSLRPCVG